MSTEIASHTLSHRQAALPAQAAPAVSVAVAAQPNASDIAAASKRPLVNPSFHLDLALNLVVLQFVDAQGDVTNSIPSAKQLKAYASHQSSPGKPALSAT